MPAPAGAIPPLNISAPTSASASGRSGDIRRSGSTVFNIGGNPNISQLAQTAGSPLVVGTVAFVAIAFLIIRRKK